MFWSHRSCKSKVVNFLTSDATHENNALTFLAVAMQLSLWKTSTKVGSFLASNATYKKYIPLVAFRFAIIRREKPLSKM